MRIQMISRRRMSYLSHAKQHKHNTLIISLTWLYLDFMLQFQGRVAKRTLLIINQAGIPQFKHSTTRVHYKRRKVAVFTPTKTLDTAKASYKQFTRLVNCSCSTAIQQKVQQSMPSLCRLLVHLKNVSATNAEIDILYQCHLNNVELWTLTFTELQLQKLHHKKAPDSLLIRFISDQIS